VTKSLEASPAPKKLEVRGLKGPKLQGCFRNTKQVLGSFDNQMWGYNYRYRVTVFNALLSWQWLYAII
jgi:hypothetical protein